MVFGPGDELAAEVAETLAVIRLDLDGPRPDVLEGLPPGQQKPRLLSRALTVTTSATRSAGPDQQRTYRDATGETLAVWHGVC
jgi:hypothetical protein